jgi:hypothetical protein
MPVHKANTLTINRQITHTIQENGSQLCKIYLKAKILEALYFLFKWQGNKYFPQTTEAIDSVTGNIFIGQTFVLN